MLRTSTTQRILQGAARWLAVLAVVGSGWLFGGADPWAYLLLAMVVNVALCFWFFGVACSREPEIRLPGLTLLLLALAALPLLQLWPLAPPAVAAVNPLSASMTGDAAAALARLNVAGPAAPAPVDFPSALSLAPEATRHSFYLAVAYVGVILILANTMRHWGNLLPVARVLVLSGFVMAVVGVMHKFSQSRDILWFHTPRYGGNIFGPFTNRNHFAAYMNMLFGVALALFISSQHITELIAWPNWRERLAWLSSRGASGIALSAFAVMVMGGAVCVSLSRGAMLSLGLALCAGGLVLTLNGKTAPGARRALAATLALVVVAILWLGRDRVVERIGALVTLLRHPSSDQRYFVTGDTLELFRAVPLVGCGFGAFRHVFSCFQTPDLQYRWLHAHNDWAQLPAEGGVVATALFILTLLAFARYVSRRFGALSHRSTLFVLGLLVGMLTIAFHSFVDYGLHKSANALLLAALIGLTLSAVHLRGRAAADRPTGERRSSAWRPSSAPGRLALRALALAALAGTILLMVREQGELRGELAFARFVYLQRAAEKAATDAVRRATVTSAVDEAQLVMLLDRGNPDALAEVTAGLLAWTADRRIPREQRTDLAALAVSSALLTVRAAPSDYLGWLSLARTQAALGAWENAEACLENARGLVRHRGQVRMFKPPRDDGK